MLSNNRARLFSLLIALGVHALVLLMLLVFRLTAAEPKPQAKVELLLVNFGTTDKSMMGNVEPAAGNVQQDEQPAAVRDQITAAQASASAEPNRPTLNSSKQSNTPTIPTEADRRGDRQEQQRKRAEEEARMRQQEARKREAEQASTIGREISGAFGRGETKASSQGNGSKDGGNQGKRDGSGSSYSLEGRSVVSNGGQLYRPTYASAIRGAIRVRITVNAVGQVTQANVDPAGTNISEFNMRAAAVSAAKKTRFNAIPGGSDQRGAITYHYDMR